MEKRKRKRKLNKVNAICRTLTARGACRLRGDRSTMKLFTKINKGETIIITKKVRSMLYPWSVNKVKYVLDAHVGSLESGYQEILNKEIPRKKFEVLFTQCAAFERLAKMDYAKKNERK